MRKMAFGKVPRLKTVLRWCACLVVCCLLALAGTNMLVPTPAQATCRITPTTITMMEGVHSVITITAFSEGNPAGFYDKLYGIQSITPPLPFGVSVGINLGPGTATISGTPPIGSARTHQICFACQEYSAPNVCYPPGPCNDGVCWPAGNTQCDRCVTLTILPAGTGGTQQGQFMPPPPAPAPAPTTYKFTVNIGPGLTSGKTEVFINGTKKADLGGGESKEFTAAIGTSPVVGVQSPVTGQQGSRFTVKGDAEKKISEGDTSAYFDYAPAVNVEFVTDPSGITALSGSGWYNIGDRVQSSAPATVESGQSGTRYQFGYWALPNGQKSQMKSLSITASTPATITASYETQYKLTVSSAYGDDWSGWFQAGSQASWQAKTSQVPMSGVMGVLGGKMKAVKPGGGITMDGPKNITVQYQPSYPWLVLLLIAAVVIGGGIFAYRRFAVARAAAPPAPAATDAAATQIATKPKAAAKATAAPVKKQAVAKKAVAPKATSKATEARSTKAKPAAGPKFCPKCGDPVEKGEIFCNNCGTKLK